MQLQTTLKSSFGRMKRLEGIEPSSQGLEGPHFTVKLQPHSGSLESYSSNISTAIRGSLGVTIWTDDS